MLLYLILKETSKIESILIYSRHIAPDLQSKCNTSQN